MKKPAQIKYIVVPTEEALQMFLKDPTMKRSLLTDKEFFTCYSIDPQGPYLHMTVSTNDRFSTLLDVQIPHHSVLYIYSGNEEKILGFRKDEPS